MEYRVTPSLAVFASSSSKLGAGNVVRLGVERLLIIPVLIWALGPGAAGQLIWLISIATLVSQTISGGPRDAVLRNYTLSSDSGH